MTRRFLATCMPTHTTPAGSISSLYAPNERVCCPPTNYTALNTALGRVVDYVRQRMQVVFRLKNIYGATATRGRRNGMTFTTHTAIFVQLTCSPLPQCNKRASSYISNLIICLLFLPIWFECWRTTQWQSCIVQSHCSHSVWSQTKLLPTDRQVKLLVVQMAERMKL